jgi:AcrR family transcriptional regulator
VNESNPNLAGLPEDRQPLQDRSRASLSRMLDAARRLLVENGSGEFSLGDVSRAGRVSIGSIYHRFDSKDELLRAVHSDFMKELTEEQTALVSGAVRNARNLPELLSLMIDEVAEFFRKHAPLLRPMMICASKDPVISAAGGVGYAHLRDLFSGALLAYRADMRCNDPQHAAVTCIKLIYAALGYELGFGAISPRLDARHWDRLKVDLAEVCTSFLMTEPVALPLPARPRSRKPHNGGAAAKPARSAGARHSASRPSIET